MEQLIFLAVIVVISVVNAIMKKMSDAKEEREQAEAMRRAGGAGASPAERPVPTQTHSPRMDSDEERTRKFMEALGLPTDALPPPVRPRPAVEQTSPTPARAARPQSPPPLPKPEPVRARSAMDPKPAPRIVPAPPLLSAAERAALDRIKSGGTSPVGNRRQSQRTAFEDNRSFASLLRNRDSLRRAFVLREILDQPPGLKSDWGTHSY